MSGMYDMSDSDALDPKSVALLFGIEESMFRAEVERQGDNGFLVPATWIKQGRRRQKLYEAATGRSDMRGAIEYWAQEEGQ